MGSSSGGLTPGQLGAILGSILGALLIVLLGLIVFLLRRSYNRRHSDPSSRTSSFWNRQTTLFTRPDSRQTPIWTGWEIVNPDDTLENGAGRSPGAGSPRGSGDETDPFLIRHSVHDNASEMQTKKSGTDTLVSIPATVALGTTSSHRSGTRGGGPILSREALMRMSEDDTPAYDIRIVPPASPPRDQNSPLLPPPPLNPDAIVNRPSEKGSDRSLASHRSMSTAPVNSISSEKSIGSFATNGPAESVELLTARRVRVGELGQSETSAQPQPADVEAQSSSVLGLDRLAGLGRLSWFRRMSLTGTSPSTRSSSRMNDSAADPYTRTPPRSGSRLGSHSRPGSWARVSRHEAAGLGPDGGTNRRSRLEMGYLAADRPVSTLSATSATSGSTVYHSAQSRPATPMGETPTLETPPPVPPLPSGHQQGLSDVSEESSRLMAGDMYENVPRDPPSYEETELSHDMASEREPSELDVLDMPVPRPASPFSAVSPRLSGSAALLALPNPAVWRDSHASSRSSAGIQIDILEETPPPARSGWRELASGSGLDITDSLNRRMTFGAPPTVVHRDALDSEEGSLHSMRSHLSPHSPQNASGSAPASSRHTLVGSNSSRPSERSYGRTPSSGMSLGHSSSISSDDRRRRRRGEPGEVISPPLSAVFNRVNPEGTPPPPFGASGTTPLPVISPSPPGYSSSLPSEGVTVTGTVTSSGTRDSGVSHATTAVTDPISGTVIHLPRLPWHSGNEERSSWHDQHVEETLW